ncbi:amidase [Actinomadura luteofluorescens]|uniref:amidase n=1 Tax=Actinomadura luteofluorescens TaxID=46163 RepID=UPI002164B1C5|nr:amidase [Actinomadura glauciflava]MCR3740583.1 amidase [Actinomadura glauciflava]
MTTWILRTDEPGDGPRLAVKDAIDVAGLPTTAGCRAVAERAEPAAADAPVVASARAQGARIVGKANLNELCMAADGVNPWTGTPVNPLDPSRVPGGSSSGSAVAVATGEADVAFGTDTSGSIRIPAACCGIAGLKTTNGRVSLDGVYPLSPTLDVVGPMGRDVAAVVLGMRLLEPGFTPAPDDPSAFGAPGTIARLRVDGVDPAIDAAVDDALRRLGPFTDVTSEHYADAATANGLIISDEAARRNGRLLAAPDLLSGRIARRIQHMIDVSGAGLLDRALAMRKAIRAELDAILARHTAIALPVLTCLPPEPDEADESDLVLTALVGQANVAGLPAFALPVPLPGSHLPTSVQLIGRAGAEEHLCALAATLESALTP